ncbi:MAG: alpha-amylase family glycosyl hydrolase [Treponema sp.]|nr:alpha-amylase family glycosyl hydrolase [Treponema sp.]
MKKLIKTLLAFAATSLLAFSCSNEITDSKALLLGFAGGNSTAKIETGSRAVATLNRSVTVTIYLFGVPATCTKPGVWAWAENGNDDIGYTAGNWPGDATDLMTADNSTGYSGYKYSLLVDPAYDLGILFNNRSGGSPQTGDIVIPKEDVATDVTYYFNWNSMAYYTSVDDCVGIMGGSITALNKSAGTATVTCTTSLLEDKTITSDVSVKDSIGTVLTVKSAVISKDVLTIKLENATENTPYTVTYAGKDKIVAVSTALIESLYGSAASALTDLGLTLNGSTATFKTWAPTASAVSVLLYDTAANAYDVLKTATFDGPGSTENDYKKDSYTPSEVEMIVDSSTGVWTASVDVSAYKYYKYKLSISGKIYYVSDIWHNVAGADSNASQIISIDDSACVPASWETSYVNPFGNSEKQTKKYNDAVIYEMHVRDWSRAVVTDSTGKFLDIANSEDIMNHLKDLGVTHVQLLPVFDYAQLNSNKKYNWGYNPYHYNVPEGRYVTDGYTDGSEAVKEMRQMIKAFHDNGIAVIMDVVYNHTSATKTGSLYDSTVPGYFYSLDESGNYYSGSGCGNNIDTRHAMVRKYVIDSLVHWVKDYHINGFRFDLMGCLDQVTMKKVYDTLYEMDKNILVYGEPWTGGSTGFDGDTEETKAALKGTSGYGVGAFDDDYRDAIKGGEFGGFAVGQIQGSYSANIETGLTGDLITKNKRNATGNTGLALHYAECHDNFTLFDKLVYSTLSTLPSGDSYAPKFAKAYAAVMDDTAKLGLIKKQVELAGAYLLLSQGTPFLNGGQEFMRTKKGDPDSYAADKKGGITWTDTAGEYNIDDVNTINLNMKTTYADVYNTYKGLIALRKANDAFTSPASCEAKNIMAGISKYTVNGSSKSFDIYFNATDNDYAPNAYKSGTTLGVGIKDKGFEYGIKGKVVSISETDGSVSYASEESVVQIPAHGFVIFEK